MIIHRIVIGSIMENAYILGTAGSKDCVVIDPGGNPDVILEQVDILGFNVSMILNTHGHADHIGGVSGIKRVSGATYAIHEKEASILDEIDRQMSDLQNEIDLYSLGSNSVIQDGQRTPQNNGRKTLIMK